METRFRHKLQRHAVSCGQGLQDCVVSSFRGMSVAADGNAAMPTHKTGMVCRPTMDMTPVLRV